VRGYDDSHIPKNQRKQSALSKNRNVLMLSVLVYQGVVTSEMEKIEVADLDLIKATIKIRGSKKHNERTLPLKAAQIGLFINYLRETRPQLSEYNRNESEKLFLPLPEFSKKNTDSEKIKYTLKSLAKQIKIINNQSIDYKQLRTSVITLWIKTYGLRKAQYMAGHRYISSTEKYLPNNLEDLTNDINKLNPFL